MKLNIDPDFRKLLVPLTPAELAHLEILFRERSEIVIYRGCYRGVNEEGICYSLSQEVASRFPSLHRYRVPNAQAIVRVATAVWEDIIALKNCRGEQEIIVRAADVLEAIELPHTWEDCESIGKAPRQ